MRNKILFALFISMLVPLNLPAQETLELVVFSGRSEALVVPVIKLFEEKTGIKVTLKTGESTALGQQILQELPTPSADIYIAKEVGSLEYLRLQKAFESYESESTKLVDPKFRAADGSWVGVSGRSRAVIFNKSLVEEKDVPKTLDELTDPKWKGKIAAANAGNESLVAWVSALRIKLGEGATTTLLKKLKDNEIQLISKSHTDIRKAVGRGEFPLGLINHYYYHLQRHETDPTMSNVGIVYLDQGTGARGELVNVSGVAIVKGAKHQSAAQRFVDFLLAPATQKVFADSNYEYPLVPGVRAQDEVFESLHCQKDNVLECLNIMDVSLDQLGPAMDQTTAMLDEVNWH